MTEHPGRKPGLGRQLSISHPKLQLSPTPKHNLPIYRFSLLIRPNLFKSLTKNSVLSNSFSLDSYFARDAPSWLLLASSPLPTLPILDRSHKHRRNKRKSRSSMPLRKRLARFGDSLSAPDKPYLSYHEATLTVGDVKSLKDDWLTDSIISFWQEYLEHETLRRYPRASVCLLRPSMAFMLLRSERLDHVAASLPDLTKVSHIFLPINNDEQVNNGKGGTHWSLLLVSLRDGNAFHYDSLGDHNKKEANATTVNLAKILGRNLAFINLDNSPRQENLNDCGVFVCLLMRHLLVKRLLSASARSQINMSMGGKMVDSNGGRKEMLLIIENLRNEARRRQS